MKIHPTSFIIVETFYALQEWYSQEKMKEIVTEEVL